MRRLTVLLLACLAFPAAAAAQDPAAPVVTTEIPRDLTHDSATFVAMVEPGASTVRVAFAYGRPGQFDLVTETREVAAGSGRTEVAIPVTGLTPSASYEVSTVAQDADHNVAGEIRAFRTAPTPRPPTVGVSDVSTSRAQSATLAGFVRSTQPARWHFEYGPTPTMGSATPEQDLGTTSQVRAAVDGLPPASTIYYRLVATSAGGVARSTVRTFVTAGLAQAVRLAFAAPVLNYGSPLIVTGTVGGVGDLTGRRVVIQRRQGTAHWSVAATGSVDATGAWWARLGTIVEPQALLAYVGDGTERATSPIAAVQVRPLTRLAVKRAKGKGPLFTVTPRPVLKGMTVTLQRRGRGGRWSRVARKTASEAAPEAAFRFRARRGAGRYRAVVTPNAAGWVVATTPERAGSLGR